MSERLSQPWEPDAQLAPVRVLIVDEETLFARAVEKRLAKEGYAPVVAGTVGEARHLLQSADPQIILLDVRLPDGSGLEFLSELRRAAERRERRGPAANDRGDDRRQAREEGRWHARHG